MASIGIFFGSDTGSTENVAKKIQMSLSATADSKVRDIANSSREDLG